MIAVEIAKREGTCTVCGQPILKGQYLAVGAEQHHGSRTCITALKDAMGAYHDRVEARLCELETD